jgi:predicted Holliday junction resolvase-like endonuclease
MKRNKKKKEAMCMWEMADTIFRFWMSLPMAVFLSLIAVIVCVALYQLIKMKQEIRRITKGARNYIEKMEKQEKQKSLRQASVKKISPYQGREELTKEERRALLSNQTEARREKAKKEEAVFNDVLREYF